MHIKLGLLDNCDFWIYKINWRFLKSLMPSFETFQKPSMTQDNVVVSRMVSATFQGVAACTSPGPSLEAFLRGNISRTISDSKWGWVCCFICLKVNGFLMEDSHVSPRRTNHNRSPKGKHQMPHFLLQLNEFMLNIQWTTPFSITVFNNGHNNILCHGVKYSSRKPRHLMSN